MKSAWKWLVPLWLAWYGAVAGSEPADIWAPAREWKGKSLPIEAEASARQILAATTLTLEALPPVLGTYRDFARLHPDLREVLGVYEELLGRIERSALAEQERDALRGRVLAEAAETLTWSLPAKAWRLRLEAEPLLAHDSGLAEDNAQKLLYLCARLGERTEAARVVSRWETEEVANRTLMYQIALHHYRFGELAKGRAWLPPGYKPRNVMDRLLAEDNLAAARAVSPLLDMEDENAALVRARLHMAEREFDQAEALLWPQLLDGKHGRSTQARMLNELHGSRGTLQAGIQRTVEALHDHADDPERRKWLLVLLGRLAHSAEDFPLALDAILLPDGARFLLDEVARKWFWECARRQDWPAAERLLERWEGGGATREEIDAARYCLAMKREGPDAAAQWLTRWEEQHPQVNTRSGMASACRAMGQRSAVIPLMEAWAADDSQSPGQRVEANLQLALHYAAEHEYERAATYCETFEQTFCFGSLTKPWYYVEALCTVRYELADRNADAIVPLLLHRRREWRLGAVRMLGKLGEERHRAALEAVLPDYAPAARAEVGAALQAIRHRVERASPKGDSLAAGVATLGKLRWFEKDPEQEGWTWAVIENRGVCLVGPERQRIYWFRAPLTALGYPHFEPTAIAFTPGTVWFGGEHALLAWYRDSNRWQRRPVPGLGDGLRVTGLAAADGRLLVIASDGPAWTFDPATNRWEQTPEL